MSPEILMTGFAGTAGAAALYRAHRTELEQIFSPRYLRGIEKAVSETKKPDFAADSVGSDAGEMRTRPDEVHVPSLSDAIWTKNLSGSLFQGLWALSQELNTGFSVEFRKIPILQETVEICNALDADPYEISSEGCILFVTENGAETSAKLAEAGIPAARIGYLTKDRKKVLKRGDEERFLNRPKKWKGGENEHCTA